MAVARGAKRSEERAAVEGVSEEGSGELRRSVLEAQGARRRDREAGTRQRQGRPARAWLPRALPLGNFPEHLAGDDVATLEPSFGHLRGIFGSRRLKQSG